MHSVLTLPAAVLLINFPGFGVKPAAAPAPVDTLPPAWKSHSRLALESQFVRAALPDLAPGGVGLRLAFDPRRLRLTADPDSGTLSAVPEVRDVAVGLPVRQSLDGYASELSERNFRDKWTETSRASINKSGPGTIGGTGTSQGFAFRLPSPLPKRVQSLLGPGGPALTVSGSENIRLSGTSNWTNQQIGPLGRRRSLFPSLDMQQDLDIRLEGQLSDRIRVNLLQNSGVSIPLANRLAINYKGDEDDLVQTLDLGNTNLSLPGTQYVSYSGRNEGLFGVKSSMRFGALDFTILASKQEGRSERASYAGGAATQRSSLADVDYVRGLYYFLYDPNGAANLIPNESIQLYVDDFNYSNDIAGQTVRARALLDPRVGLAPAPGDSAANADTISVRGSFQQLIQGDDADYQVLSNELYGEFYKVIRLRSPLSGDQRLAVSYVARPLLGFSGGQPVFGPDVAVGGQRVADTAPDTTSTLILKLLRAPASRVPQDAATGLFDTTKVLARTRELELRNVYQLPGRGIDPRSLKLTIRRGVDDPPLTFITTPATGDTAISYLEVLGLDNYDESSGSTTLGHDGVVDRPVSDGSTRGFVDYENGVLFFWDLRPFAPRLGGAAGVRPFEAFLDGFLNRRARLTGGRDDLDGANAAIYDQYYVQRQLDARYWIDVEFNAQRATGEISLGRGNLLDGSEVVTINGQALQRDRDYTIDYDLGRLTLKRQLGPSDQLNVNYSYAPLFASAGRTLVGSAFKLEGRDRQFGGAFMYESKGAQDLRPRLGEEPSRTIIGDLNTDWTMRPGWLTRMVDALPGVRTTAASELRVQAEVGASFPNPNTRNEVYIDDMEGVRDAVGLTLDALRWRHSSVPRSNDPRATSGRVSDYRRNTEIRWYSPPSSVEERDLKPNLSEAQGARNKRQVLAISLPRRPAAAAPTDTLWAGLTYVLDPVGLDLSRAQFIELWVSDFADQHSGVPVPRVRGRGVRLHVDLGVVGEDQQRAPSEPPNDLLDGEDREPFDGQLSVVSGNDEDTGYDGVLDADGEPAVADLTTAGGADPAGDDFGNVDEAFEDIDPRRYLRVNGTEGNRTLYPIPDTEDLNGNYNLDREEDFYRWTIHLSASDSTYFEQPAGANGWRRYRIPIPDERRETFGSPDLTLARHVRVWLDGVIETDDLTAEVRRPFLMLGGLEIVGSRWQATALTPGQAGAGTELTILSKNSVDNVPEYVPPFDPGSTRTTSQELERREQSLVLDFRGLQPDDTLEVFKAFSVDENYSRYGKLAWYAAGFRVRDSLGADYDADNDALWYYVRFASDEIGRSYYEYKARVPRNSLTGSIRWADVRLPLLALSNLKLESDFPVSGDILYRAAGPFGGDSVVIRGRPSFTRLRRISVGLVNPPGSRPFTGELWFNELRATDVAKDRGLAQRVLVTGNLANLIRYNATWDGRDADFVTVGQSRGTGNSTDQLNLGGTLELHRFFEGTGIILPVNVSFSRSSSRPRFTAGDDVLRTGALAEASETRNESRSFSTSYARQWSDRSNPLLRYTVGGLSGRYSRSQSDGRNPNGTSNGTSSSLGVDWAIAPRNLWSAPLPLLRQRFYPLPERLNWNYVTTRTESRTFQRTPDGSGLVPSSANRGQTSTLAFGGDIRPIDLYHYHVDGVRNLNLGELNEKLGPLNLGRVVTWRQNMDVRYAVNRGTFLNPTVSWASTYAQDNRPELSRDLSVRAIGNGQNVTFSWGLPFDRLMARAPGAGRPGAAVPPGRARPSPADSAGRDSAARVRPPFQWRDAVSRLGNVTLDASYNRSSNYSRLVGIPSFRYLVGLSDDPGFSPDSGGRIRSEFGSIASFARDWRGSARTRLLLPFDASVMTRAEVSSRRTENNGVVNRAVQSRFPDFDVDYGRVASAVGLTRFFTNPRLRTAYSRSRNTDYRNRQDTPSSISTSSQWQPLLGLDGELKSQWRVKLQVQRRITQSERFQLGNSVQTDRNTDVSLDLSRSLSRGQKVRILNRETTVRSSITMTLSGVYSRRSGETLQRDKPGSRPQFPVDQDRLSLNGTGSYQFSNNVTGNASLGFGQTRDLQRGIVTRNVRVELRASFTF